MLKAFFRIRYMTVLAVLASLLGAALLLVIGSAGVIEAFALYLGFLTPHVAGNEAKEAGGRPESLSSHCQAAGG